MTRADAPAPPAETPAAAPTAENPYRAPAPPPPLPPTVAPGAGAGGIVAAFRDLPFDGRTGLSTALVRLLGAHIALAILEAAVFVWLLSSTGGDAEPGTEAGQSPVLYRGILEALWILRELLAFATAVTFFFWLRRKHANLHDLGARGLTYSRHWITAAFLVPVLNLLGPYRVTVEVWSASNPTLPLREPFAWKTAPDRRGIVVWWWALLLGSEVVAFWTRSAVGSKDSLDTVRQGLQAGAATSALWFAAALLAMALVRRLDERQLDRWNRIRSETAASLAPFGAPDAFGAPGAPGTPVVPLVPAGPHCPECLTPFNPADYRKDAEHIYCSHCRAELPR